MEPPLYQSKWEALSRAYQRLSEFYEGKIDLLHSFQSPKDFVYSYFHSTYSLKESLKLLPGFDGKQGLVEVFIASAPGIALGIDISNTEKHGVLSNPKSASTIGSLNTHIHILDPQGHDRTELTLEVDGVRKDCLELANFNLALWKDFLRLHNLLPPPDLIV